MATIPTQEHPSLAVPFSATTDFTVLAGHCETFAETLIESNVPCGNECPALAAYRWRREVYRRCGGQSMMQSDWHPADIIAGLKKRGTSLSALSRQAGLASSTLANALTRRWPKGERLVAEALDVAPENIWPSCYR